MSQPHRIFLVGSIYHIFNRGVEKRTIFKSSKDYRHFLRVLAYYQQADLKPRLSYNNDFILSDRSDDLLFDVIAYCLMPNHFHLILKQNRENGISRGISNSLNSYCRYFNAKYSRIGPLFQSRFKSVNVLNSDQFMHLTRYVFLNPYVNHLTPEPLLYPWSSINEYFSEKIKFGFCAQNEILEHFKDRQSFESFITDYADYATVLEQIKHEVLE